ncbi:MAG: hypothetical protein QOJ79_199 [Actinomycetota bacterium]|jgi:uncharacterized membrane protein (TIGR02234 family)|nr:hypothetical protein [Actinomycetota bacterium]
MNSRRELVVAVLLCLVGSSAVLLAVSRAWVSYQLPAAAPLPAKSFQVDGTRLAPGARALALVGLAGVAAVLATRRLGRAVIGGLLAAAGLGIVGVVGRALADPDAAIRRSRPFVDVHFARGASLGPWPYVALLGALLVAAAGVVVAVRGRSWAAMSERYDAPARTSPGEGSLWEALDRGEDPTNEVDRSDG